MKVVVSNSFGNMVEAGIAVVALTRPLIKSTSPFSYCANTESPGDAKFEPGNRLWRTWADAPSCHCRPTAQKSEDCP